MIVFAYLRWATNDDVRINATIFADLHLRANHAVRADRA